MSRSASRKGIFSIRVPLRLGSGVRAAPGPRRTRASRRRPVGASGSSYSGVSSSPLLAPGDVVFVPGMRPPDDVLERHRRCPRRCSRPRRAVPQTMFVASAVARCPTRCSRHRATPSVPQTMFAQLLPPQSVPQTMFSPSRERAPDDVLAASPQCPRRCFRSRRRACPRRCSRPRRSCRCPRRC